jgi:hypothetical protein
MRDRIEPADPGDDEVRSLTWRGDDTIPSGARVEATDGVLGTVRERRMGEGPEHAYLAVDTDQGLFYVPERLVRETRGNTVVLSLPRADVLAQSSPDTLPVRDAPDQLPHPPR